jgi:hypothetical protein
MYIVPSCLWFTTVNDDFKGCKLSFTGDTLVEPVKQMFVTAKSVLTVANHKLEGSHSHSNANVSFSVP